MKRGWPVEPKGTALTTADVLYLTCEEADKRKMLCGHGWLNMVKSIRVRSRSLPVVKAVETVAVVVKAPKRLVAISDEYLMLRAF